MLHIDILLEGNQELASNLLAAAQALAEDGIKQFEVQIAEKAMEVVREHTPRITGSWASSWSIYPEQSSTVIAINPAAINPVSPERPAEYGPKVHAMGGSSRSGHKRAVLDVVVKEYGQDLLEEAGDEFVVSLEVFR